MGAECCICGVFLHGDVVSYAHFGGTYSLLGAMVEELADRLVECVCTVLRCSGTVVVVLASVCARKRTGRGDGRISPCKWDN